jgi:hypothetical protein
MIDLEEDELLSDMKNAYNSVLIRAKQEGFSARHRGFYKL